MTHPSWLAFAPLLAALVWAAVQDVRTRTIRNELTVAMVVAGLVQSCLATGTVGPGQAALGMAAGFGLGLGMFVLGALGGGDVKLLAAVGAWLGPAGAVATFAGAAIVGLFIVVGQAAWSGRLAALCRNSALIAVNVLHVTQLGTEHAAHTGRTHTSVGRPLPYAVPVLAAVVLAVVLRPG